MKEAFININDGFIKWWGPNTSGSEPFAEGEKNEVLGRIINSLIDLAKARGEDWSFRINKQPGV
jgi:hypothetical protein